MNRLTLVNRSCEILMVIRFLIFQNDTATNIHRKLMEGYGNDVTCRQQVRKWVRLFRKGRTEIHDEEGSGRLSVVSDEFMRKVEEKVRNSRHVTLDDLYYYYYLFYIFLSRSPWRNRFGKLGYKKLCARWVSRMFIPGYCHNRVLAAREFLDRFEREGEKFLDIIVTDDETSVCHYYTPESKRQSL